MTRAELLAVAKPILFNTPMVQAILNGNKTVTRRVIKLPQCGYFENDPPRVKLPYKVGDILYVRETWARVDNEIVYRADDEIPEGWHLTAWHPSIHMTKEAARIFLRVTAVRVEHLQDITGEQAIKEGVGDLFIQHIAYSEKDYETDVDENYGIAKEQYAWLWDSTVKKADLDEYGWNANSWVWVIEFERIEVK